MGDVQAPCSFTPRGPIIRTKSGAGFYEDAGDAKRQKRTKIKTGFLLLEFKVLRKFQEAEPAR